MKPWIKLVSSGSTHLQCRTRHHMALQGMLARPGQLDTPKAGIGCAGSRGCWVCSFTLAPKLQKACDLRPHTLKGPLRRQEPKHQATQHKRGEGSKITGCLACLISPAPSHGICSLPHAHSGLRRQGFRELIKRWPLFDPLRPSVEVHSPIICSQRESRFSVQCQAGEREFACDS